MVYATREVLKQLLGVTVKIGLAEPMCHRYSLPTYVCVVYSVFEYRIVRAMYAGRVGKV